MKCRSIPRPVFLIILSIAVSVACAAQEGTPDPEAAVEQAVNDLFDAMRTADSSAVRSAFLPNATLQSVSEDESQKGSFVLNEGSIDAFVEAVGGEHPVFDEQISNLQIHVDAGLATAWMDYEFYLGDELSHCGVNAFQYVLTDAGWKILHVTDTRRKTCE